MKLMTPEEAKQVELDILSNVADFCDAHNLRYCLAYGTLIGAVRHKGFIPWDDDIDIWMPRADYNEFLQRYNNKNGNDRYTVISPYDKRSQHTFAKVIDEATVKFEANADYINGHLGVDVDIFPLDGMPEDEQEYIRWYNKLHNIYRKIVYLILDEKKNVKRRVLLPLIRLWVGGKAGILRKTAKLHKQYPFNESTYVGSVESHYNASNNRFKKEWFDSFLLVKFENKEFKIPTEYDKILTQIYGDYMQLPPEEQQKTHHINKMYWLEDNR